jgi:hypothetical protein
MVVAKILPVYKKKKQASKRNDYSYVQGKGLWAAVIQVS